MCHHGTVQTYRVLLASTAGCQRLPQDAKNITAKVLVLHGADDPFVKADEVAAFQDEMRKGRVDWQFVSYGNAVHGFTNKAGKPGGLESGFS